MFRYWRQLTRFLLNSRRFPETADDLMPWCMARAVHLWNQPCHSNGDTFSGYIVRSGVNLPAFVIRQRSVVVAALYSWPLIAWFITRKHGADSGIHRHRAMRRPDLYAAFPRMPFSEQAVAERRSDMMHAVVNAWDFWARRSPDYAIEDKRIFETRAREAGLPAVKSLSRDEARSVGGPYIVKDSTQDMGLGITVVETFDALRAQLSDANVIVQSRLQNHPALRDILPDNAPLCTLRLLTTAVDGDIVCHIAYFRIGAAGSTIDNLSRGGTLVEVNLDTGRLMNGVPYDALQGRTPVGSGIDRVVGAAHPFVGDALPLFADSVALVKHAHRTIAPAVLSIGWDVALTSDGPVLIEANVYAGSYEIFQFRQSFDVGSRAILERMVSHATRGPSSTRSSSEIDSAARR